MSTNIWTTKNLVFSYSHPYSKFKPLECSQPLLSITTINPPENLVSFNTGSSLEKWKKKIPRLRSSKSARPKPVSADSAETDASDALDNSNDAAVEQQFIGANSVEEKDESEYEIDPDVQKLLYETHEDDADREIQKTRPKHKRKKADGKKQDILETKHTKSKRRTKVIRFSLSKPPSPETIQVIRVDVTSNYSVEDAENIENERESPECRTERTRKLARNLGRKVESKSSEAFILKCEKLALTDRK